ncbi:conserved hypothetical protein [Talaromyces stipitatus ATCC 10500]|uniref:Uncharacterized protein n=1 Tax=Talaromyces stipitatus (strain ATCC 10500 / CBS 375.48 / QM 6759 / NRRL 1006) TaxID=441959 RepID=B8MEA4_TALSN|nr:uncharacterized protein TSTA_016110 [Talaromyces stipitatus ATCC 10500]XP_002483766.1 uncharacterized protein TSTA_016110 [Talaromyces stipitatus ATCC 10500]EED16531.1 conserved hypothetical protein [Talaromyces stipitatus ATCC 10500]EED16532.1 conserved hypothetical protein [Talaromyces stipitatus ATCC 10500]
MSQRTFAAIDDSLSLETPRVSGSSTLSISALARFEFEAGKGNDGTKILMVEWEDDDISRSSTGSWHVSWEGKTTVLPADEQTTENTNRFYFLLPPKTTVPPVIDLTYTPHPESASTVRQPESIQINPLPAIFPPELGATARTAGKKGVLHTIWAKKRLQVLDNEIKSESATNVEGIALQMAIQEKEWIEENYGVSSPPSVIQKASSSDQAIFSTPSSPLTMVSPGGSRSLGEKLKGLRLDTSETTPSKRSEDYKSDGSGQTGDTDRYHLLSPQTRDVAVSSFSAFSHVSQPDNEVQSYVAHNPPASIQKAQSNAGDFVFMSTLTRTESTDSADGLFAKALSPRTPDLPVSPFSFSRSDTMAYVSNRS